MQQFFFDNQLRRFLLQFTRIFSNFQVEFGLDDNQQPILQRVPVRYGDATRQALAALQNNSASTLPAAPLMSFYITGMEHARDRMQEPFHVNKMHVRQRSWDQDSGTYETTQGNAFTIERLMPVPYKMSINLDIWTSNNNQKHQLFEQIATLFNPSLEIQSTDNYIDWTSLSVVELERSNWSSRTIPMGTTDSIDIMTMSFAMPIWISPPAKVRKLGVVNRIIASVFDSQGDAVDAIANNDLLLGTRQKFTPYGYQILLLGNQVQLLPPGSIDPDRNTLEQSESSATAAWKPLIDHFGVLNSGISQLVIDNPYDENSKIVGQIAYHPTDDRFLLFELDEDTIPGNTLPPVTAIVDPTRSGPGAGLPAAAAGQRYLLIAAIGSDQNSSPAAAWGDVVAQPNSIIERNGSQWEVVFDPDTHNDSVEFVTNITTEVQYRWDGQQWLKSYQGMYQEGEWSIVL